MGSHKLLKANQEIDKEIWVTITGYSNYEVSNLARIRSVKMKTYVNQRISTIGYPVVYLAKDHYSRKELLYVHRIVALAFIANPGGKPQVNHIDGIKHNNLLENLQWVTKSENAIHAVAMGLTVVPNLKGENSPTSKLKESDVIDILKMGLVCEITAIKISKIYDVHSSLINLILKGKIWNDQYNAFKKVFLL